MYDAREYNARRIVSAGERDPLGLNAFERWSGKWDRAAQAGLQARQVLVKNDLGTFVCRAG